MKIFKTDKYYYAPNILIFTILLLVCFATLVIKSYVHPWVGHGKEKLYFPF